MKRGFTLLEMLVVIGILAVLIGAGMTSFSSATRKAQQARAREVVSNVATALEVIYQRDGAFPRRVLAKGKSDGEMDEDVAYELAKRGVMTLNWIKPTDDNPNPPTKTVSADRFGVLTPWAQDVVKRSKSGISESTKVPSGGTIKDHRIHFAVDHDGDGYVEAQVEGDTVKIRASAVAWCCGRDGKRMGYSEGLRHDCSYSWSRQQVESGN